MVNQRFRVCLVTFLFEKAFTTPLANLQKVLSFTAQDVFVVTGGADNFVSKTISKNKIYHINYSSQKRSVFYRLMFYLQMQIRIAITLAKLSRSVDLYIFFMEDSPGFPLLIVKSLRKNVLLLIPSATTQTYNSPISKLLTALKYLSYAFSDCIVVYSTNIVKQWGLMRYQNKLLFGHEHFMDFNNFRICTAFKNRKKLVGYIGRLSSEKGVENFLASIPNILKHLPDQNFLIGGSGELLDLIEFQLKKMNLQQKVTLTGWINHDAMYAYLNQFSLLVVPSYTEGLPNVILEAMACGTPVLASPVGAVPDIIQNGVNGFLLQSNQPQDIANEVISLLNQPALLETVGETANYWVHANFSIEKTVKIWQDLFAKLQ